jgi:hypothetical protein
VIVIAGQIIRTPDKYGDIPKTEMPILAGVLRTIWLAEMTKRLNAFVTKHSEALDNLNELIALEARRLETLDLLSEIETEPNRSAVEAEAIQIATERIAAHLARHNLAGPPWPPDRRGHIEFQAKSPEVLAEARRRVEARLLAGATLIAETRGTSP